MNKSGSKEIVSILKWILMSGNGNLLIRQKKQVKKKEFCLAGSDPVRSH
jgi:hypothetical protein